MVYSMGFVPDDDDDNQ